MGENTNYMCSITFKWMHQEISMKCSINEFQQLKFKGLIELVKTSLFRSISAINKKSNKRHFKNNKVGCSRVLLTQKDGDDARIIFNESGSKNVIKLMLPERGVLSEMWFQKTVEICCQHIILHNYNLI